MRFWRTSEWFSLKALIEDEGGFITPKPTLIFRPLALTRSPKVVMVFPEVYSREGVADGLALSFASEKKGKLNAATTPFLFWCIQKKLEQELKIRITKSDLSHWAHRGVLLWNARPTTAIQKPGAHKGLGWEKLTQEIVETAYLNDPRCVFVFLGETQKYSDTLPNDAHVVLADFPAMYGEGSVFWDQPLFGAIHDHLKGTKRKINWKV